MKFVELFIGLLFIAMVFSLGMSMILNLVDSILIMIGGFIFVGVSIYLLFNLEYLGKLIR